MNIKMRAILLQMVDIIVGIVLLFLSIRLLLKLLGANPEAGFVSWIYKTSQPLLEPFSGMFPTPAIEAGYILEFSTIFAIFIYALAAWLLKEFIKFMATMTHDRTHNNPKQNVL